MPYHTHTLVPLQALLPHYHLLLNKQTFSFLNPCLVIINKHFCPYLHSTQFQELYFLHIMYSVQGFGLHVNGQ